MYKLVFLRPKLRAARIGGEFPSRKSALDLFRVMGGDADKLDTDGRAPHPKQVGEVLLIRI